MRSASSSPPLPAPSPQSEAAAPRKQASPPRLRIERAGLLGRLTRVALVFGALGTAVALELPLCPFAITTGKPCPGCGLTRAGLALLFGDLNAALAFHPLSPLLVPLVALFVGANALAYAAQGRWAVAEGLRGRPATVASLLLGALLLGVWVARFLGAFGGPVPV